MDKDEEPILIDATSTLLRDGNVNNILKIIKTNGYGSIEKLSDAVLMIGILASTIKELTEQLERRNII